MQKDNRGRGLCKQGNIISLGISCVGIIAGFCHIFYRGFGRIREKCFFLWEIVKFSHTSQEFVPAKGEAGGAGLSERGKSF